MLGSLSKAQILC